MRPIVLVPLATQAVVNAAEFLSSEVFTVYPLSAAPRPGRAPGGNKVLAYQLQKKKLKNHLPGGESSWPKERNGEINPKKTRARVEEGQPARAAVPFRSV